VRTAHHDFRIETFVDDRVHPHSMAFTPDGDVLITERPGRLRIVRNGVLLKTSVTGLPEVLALGRGATPQDGREQAGLRDVVLHPEFATNRLIYLSYVKPGENGFGNLAVARGRLESDRLHDVREIFHAKAPGNGTNRSSMWGGRLAFDRQRVHHPRRSAVARGRRFVEAPGAGPLDAQRYDRAAPRRRPSTCGQSVRQHSWCAA
jgi:glucose/arabinose dehydrogenase